jgi:hypothetical protein
MPLGDVNTLFRASARSLPVEPLSRHPFLMEPLIQEMVVQGYIFDESYDNSVED